MAKKKTAPKKKLPFAVNDYVVYPTHGVGQVTAIEEQEISGHKLQLFIITFDKDKMTLRVPTARASRPSASAGFFLKTVHCGHAGSWR